MSKRFKNSIFSLLILLIIGSGYLAGEINQERSSTQLESDNTEKVQWLTCTNEKYGYSIDYPEGWTITKLDMEALSPLSVEIESCDDAEGNASFLEKAIHNRDGRRGDSFSISIIELDSSLNPQDPLAHIRDYPNLPTLYQPELEEIEPITLPGPVFMYQQGVQNFEYSYTGHRPILGGEGYEIAIQTATVNIHSYRAFGENKVAIIGVRSNSNEFADRVVRSLRIHSADRSSRHESTQEERDTNNTR